MLKVIRHTKNSHGTQYYDILKGGQSLGKFIVDNDGFYNYWPEDTREGYLTSEILLEMGQQLKEINDPIIFGENK